MAVFASKGRLFHSIDALCLKLRFKKLVFGFGSARSISWFRKLYCLLRSLSLMSISLKHGEQLSLTILYSKTLIRDKKIIFLLVDPLNFAHLRCRVAHSKLCKRLLDLILSSYLVPITLAAQFCNIWHLFICGH